MGDEYRVSTTYLRHLAGFAPGELDRRYFAAVVAEMDRLRAALEDAKRVEDLRLIEIDHLHPTVEALHRELDAADAEIERLQALIDAFVAVDQNPDDTGWDDAYNALLAAATKEDGRD